ncbi:MAG TPA: formyltransferase family protein [Candidatus Sumerlaeota bacterium]|nr:formyltransferase family protein [Candidatus Sumerlaeota bacterium]HPK02878.1 formyltransferase family protein [Candidatus Sumerlaeota bacterium]
MERRIGILGCKHTTLDLIRALRRAGVPLQQVITLPPALGRRHQVAGYLDLRDELDRLAIPWTHATDYALNAEADRRALPRLGLDLLLVMGWQRLVPEWFLDCLPLGAWGMHGSCRPLPHGRGRSPLNWSIITGQDTFYTHLFRYLPGVDDGPVAGQIVFDINPYDTALTLHKKNQIAMIRLVLEKLPAILAGRVEPTPQPAEPPSYWPKRNPEDGIIFWEDPANVICRLVRAVSRPFPGAFCFLDDDPGRKLTIWQAQPFDRRLTWPDAAPGEIVAVFHDATFVVRCGDATVLVTESEGVRLTDEDLGRRLGSAGIKRKVWPNLPPL